MGKAAIYNPYLDALGGGERYTFSFAKVLMDHGWKVDCQWHNAKIKSDVEKRFGLNLQDLNIVPDVKRGDGYDLCFWVSDGSIPSLLARKNILHFQIPFHDVGGKNLLNRMKFFRISKIVSNSIFTKNFIDREYGINSSVLYPPVPVTDIKSKRKENVILYVGRFSRLKQSKRHDILIKAFKKFSDNGFNDWKLILAGGGGDSEYIKKLGALSESYPISIVVNPSFDELKNLYGTARIFWAAAGYGENENKFPEKVEHFGISVVEAMAAGAIPLVCNSGGFKEIVNDEINGYLWDKPAQLVSKTKKIIVNKEYVKLAQNAKDRAKDFSYEQFEKGVLALI